MVFSFLIRLMCVSGMISRDSNLVDNRVDSKCQAGISYSETIKLIKNGVTFQLLNRVLDSLFFS